MNIDLNAANSPNDVSKTFILDKKTMTEYKNQDIYKTYDDVTFHSPGTSIDPYLQKSYFNKTNVMDVATSMGFGVLLDRKVSADEIFSLERNWMPGFRLTWSYSPEVAGKAYDTLIAKDEFVR